MNELRSSVDGTQDPATQERILFFRSSELPGVEIRVLENSSRLWRCFSAGFEFVAPDTWQGALAARNRREELVPGKLFCSCPGEVYSTPRVTRAGGLRALVLDPEVLSELLAEHGTDVSEIEFRRVVKMSDVLKAKLENVFDAFRSAAPVESQRASLEEFITVLVNELVERRGAPAGEAAATTPAERVREYLELDPSAPTDLRTLSSRTGLSRFQVLRAFRSSYGLPPHAYKLCVRIGLAQKALRRGSAPAEVAAEYGFVDQSHFTRHFKRLVGVTPLEYAFARSRQRRPRAQAAA